MQHYQYGSIPPRPDQVIAVDQRRKPHQSGLGTELWLTLVIDSQKQLRMRAVLYIPHAKGPYPVVIREEGTLGRTEQIPLFLEKGYMFVEYARHDLDPDKRDVVGPAQKAYPTYDWATLAVWAWGGMRVIDYLESREDVDRKRIAITGHSRGGKMALLAGAFDQRIALVVPNGSGAGGAGSYRVLGPGAEALSMNDKPHWYHERILQFAGKIDRLPFDQHFLKALVAPRALLCTESLDDDFANPLGTQATSVAVQDIYRFFKASATRNGLHYRRGKHDSNTDDWQALLDFAEWHFFGRVPQSPDRFWQTPLPVPTEFAPRHARAAPPSRSETTSPETAQTTPAMTTTTIDFVEVGDPGNVSDRDFFGRGAYGAVARTFQISKQKITNAQYAKFLNAVAVVVDAHGLYNVQMEHSKKGGIVRSEKANRLTYVVKNNMGQRPVNFVSWYDALRFCNWLHNGKPAGEQNTRTTEGGAYTFVGPRSVAGRNANARFFMPSEDEWYKAAYFQPGPSRSAGYRLFEVDQEGDLSVVSHEPHGQSAYGMEELADGVWEWNQANVSGIFRGLRTAAWFLGNNKQAAGRFYSNPELELANVGFRVGQAK